MAKSAKDRIQELLEQWSLKEPALFLAITTHKLSANPAIETIRIGNGMVEYNPEFIGSLDKETLRELMKFEATRILLKHPYERHQPKPALSFLASTIAIREHLATSLSLPTAADVFGDHKWDKSFFEFYYRKLESEVLSLSGIDIGIILNLAVDEGTDEIEQHLLAAGENAALWGEDLLLTEMINRVIEEVSQSKQWGSIPGDLQETILATLKPRLDYRKVLRGFRSSIISSNRTLTRMKPNRRYGFLYMGSRRDFVTRLLFAVDVSGSVSSEDLAKGFSIVNRFFTYGIESIDVIQFDTDIKGPTLSLKKAKHSIEIVGRGGTSFQPAMDYMESNPGYDGLIMFTDGYAPMPSRPDNCPPSRILWLFNSEENWRRMEPDVTKNRMRSAFVMEAAS